MISYEVLLGIDHAARDTGRRITMRVRECDPVQAAIKAERMADKRLSDPDVEYTHAMRVTPVMPPSASAVMAMAA
jgi:hypothetical protein